MDLLNEAARFAIDRAQTYGPRLGEAALLMVAYGIGAAIARRALIRAARAAGERAAVLALIGESLNVALLAIGAVSALGALGVNVTALMAGLGLTGFALGFALRDILSNLLSGVLILLYQPFRVDDHIIVSGLEGRVLAVDLRYTTLEASSGRILIPNANLFTQTVTVLNPAQVPQPLETPSSRI
ncbi:MAG: mechanosensitive ion channel domain-containing protein [Gammaproteobacteria bacterium]